MKFRVEFATDNAAFDENDLRQEISGIFEAITTALVEGYQAGRVRDSNGNTIGHWSFDLPYS